MKKILLTMLVALASAGIYADNKAACIQKATTDAKAGHKACEAKEKADRSKCKQEVKIQYAMARKVCGQPIVKPEVLAAPPAAPTEKK